MNILETLDKVHAAVAPINFSLLLMRHRRVLKPAKIQKAVTTFRDAADLLERLLGSAQK